MREQTENKIMLVLFIAVIILVFWAVFCPAASAQDVTSSTQAFRVILSEPCAYPPSLQFLDSAGQICPMSKAEAITATEYRIVLTLQWVDATGSPRKAADGWGRFDLIEPLVNMGGKEGREITKGRSWRILLAGPRIIEIRAEE